MVLLQLPLPCQFSLFLSYFFSTFGSQYWPHDARFTLKTVPATFKTLCCQNPSSLLLVKYYSHVWYQVARYISLHFHFFQHNSSNISGRGLLDGLFLFYFLVVSAPTSVTRLPKSSAISKTEYLILIKDGNQKLYTCVPMDGMTDGPRCAPSCNMVSVGNCKLIFKPIKSSRLGWIWSPLSSPPDLALDCKIQSSRLSVKPVYLQAGTFSSISQSLLENK